MNDTDRLIAYEHDRQHQHYWWMIREPIKGIEIACFRERHAAESYVKWHAAGLVLNPDAYEIVHCSIEAEEASEDEVGRILRDGEI